MRTPGGPGEKRQDGHSELTGSGPDQQFLDSYLQRIGLTTDDVTRPDLDDHVLLALIVRAQLAAVPFENLMIHEKKIVDVEPSDIERKILGDHRGGICYEVNGLLARALITLGFEVDLVGAAIIRDDGTIGPALGHMAVIATSDDRQWLLDTGFGGSSVLTPITAEQMHAPIDITTSTGRYRTDGTMHELRDFAEMARWQSTSPAARFTGSIICSVTDDTHRVTMSRPPAADFTLTRTDLVTGEQHRVAVADGAVCAAFDEHFGIALTHPPTVAQFA